MKALIFQHIVLWILILVFLGTVIVLKLISNSNRIHYTAEDFSESDKPLQNPYCGFYHIIGYTLADDDTPIDNADYQIDLYTESLVLLEINLKNYRMTEISQKGIAQLNDILDAWSNSPNRTKLILRFLYDWDGVAFATEPDSLSIILHHMEQISQSVNRYRDTVYMMQGVFIGNWGEMHHSKFSDLDSVQILIHRLHELIAPSIYLSVRTPSLWRAVNNRYKPLEEFSSSETDNTLANRLGLFNDGILGSETDLGTYGSTLKKDADTPSYQGTRKEELEFQNKLCRTVPNGGEVVYNNNLSGLENAVSTLKEMHVSYLNADYDSRVLKKWKKSVWTGDDAFNGCDGYTYMQAHLGYRYLIESCEIKKSGLMKPDYTLCLTIKNNGFSNTLKPFESSVTIISAETEENICIPFDADLRSLWSGSK